MRYNGDHITTKPNPSIAMINMKLDDFSPVADLAHASTLPARWYIDPAFLPLEKEKIFWRTWQVVGREETVARIGDFFACEVAGERLVITRGLDGQLRGFFNICRHRAGAVAEGKGNRKSLQCLYHGWTYSLEGKLLNAPEMAGVANFDKDAFCLPPVRVETWGGFIFVNLDEQAPSLAEWLGDIPLQVANAGFQLADMRMVERREYLINCNWKVFADNYLEGYHIPIAHPGLFKELDYDQYRVDTYRYYSAQYAPIREMKPGQEFGRDRRVVRTSAEARALYYWIFPNFMLNIYPDNMSDIIILPLGHDQTLLIGEWFFQEPGTGDGWESLQEAIRFSDEIKREDIALCEMTQRGLNSRHYHQGRFSAQRENGVHHFHLLVHEFLTKKEQL